MGGLGAFLGNVVGSVIQNDQARREAGRNRQFEREMSDTAHQREVWDLQKAGLNPILSANGGASTPAGNMAPVENVMSGAISSAMEKERLDKEIEKMDSEIAANAAAAAAQRATARMNLASARQTEIETPYINSRSQVLKSVMDGANPVVQKVRQGWGEINTAKDNVLEKLEAGKSTIPEANLDKVRDKMQIKKYEIKQQMQNKRY